MIGTEFLRELVETVILTAKVKNCDPVSLLLIAAPESGKTSIVLERPCKTVEAYADVTGRGIHFILSQNRDISHIIINDLVAVLSHRASVNRYTLSVLNAITEEGLEQIATPIGIQKFDGKTRKGIITSLTLDLCGDARHWWVKTGFSSRMLPFCYFYPQELVVKIKESITDRKGARRDKSGVLEFVVPDKEIDVDYPQEYRHSVQMLSEFRSRILDDPSGLRRLQQYHAIVQAHAILRNSSDDPVIVTIDDMQFLSHMDLFVSYTTPQPL